MFKYKHIQLSKFLYLETHFIFTYYPQPFNFFDWLNRAKTPEHKQESRRVLHDVEEHDVKSGRKD